MSKGSLPVLGGGIPTGAGRLWRLKLPPPPPGACTAPLRYSGPVGDASNGGAGRNDVPPGVAAAAADDSGSSSVLKSMRLLDTDSAMK
jgi:hypothetical protein